VNQIRVALVVVSLTTGAFAGAGAQMTSIKQGGTAPKAGCGPFSMVAVRVVDARGKNVTGAHLEVWRKRDRKKLAARTDAVTLTGEYIVADDLALSLVAASGEEFEVRVTFGKRVVDNTLRLAHSADGCHVRLVGPTAAIVLPS